MGKFRGGTTAALLLVLGLWVAAMPREFAGTVRGDDHGSQSMAPKQQEKPSPLEMARDIYSLVARSSLSSWDKLKYFVYQLQAQVFPPDLDFRKTHGAEPEGGGGAGGRMKEAARQSFERSAETVGGSAKSVADAVGEAVHKTAEKMMETASDSGRHDEL
ncbi:uncharacterized protein LOC127799868 [Diospyros lotus]|uniref:uncharacterized protein LOC127799868 n=1 Tax=Diospyros lotus TaxID=55363 RepID=UPI0022556C06|nr:uncharacterized protein LOC127799868 [Diospyros lotus]